MTGIRNSFLSDEKMALLAGNNLLLPSPVRNNPFFDLIFFINRSETRGSNDWITPCVSRISLTRANLLYFFSLRFTEIGFTKGNRFRVFI
jgi:hypothetical protein